MNRLFDKDRTKKKLKLALLGMACILLLSSIVFYYYVLGINEEYKLLVDARRTDLVLFQKLTFESNRAYIMLYQIIHARTSDELHGFIQKRQAIHDSNTYYLDSLSRVNSIHLSDKVLLDSLLMTRAEYYRRSMDFISKCSRMKSPEIENELSERVEPIFVRYQMYLSELAKHIDKQLNSKSDMLSAGVRENGLKFLLIGISPILVFIVYICIILAVMGIIAIYMYKRVDFPL